MKVACIVPMKDVKRTFDGDYAMCLTHLADYYPETHHKNCYVIMDNSLIELGEAASIEATLAAAIKCNAHEVILPDVFKDGQKTLLKVKESLAFLRANNTLNLFNIMAVCQGKDMEEFEWCFKQLCAIPEIHCIGIPKVAETLHIKGRPGFEYMWQNCSKTIHLLGCWSSLSELKLYKNPAKIRSCDTCIPALLSGHGIFNVWDKRPEKNIDLLNDKINAAVYDELLDQLMGGRLL